MIWLVRVCGEKYVMGRQEEEEKKKKRRRREEGKYREGENVYLSW